MTDRFVAGVKAAGRQDYFDTVTRGLVLRVTPHGRKTWNWFYTSPRDGKRARVALGTYPALPLAVARTKALEAAGQVAGGSDPRHGLKASAAMTVANLAHEYLADPRKQRLRTAIELKRRFYRNVIPRIGDLRIAELTRRDVRNVFEAIERSGSPMTARRVFEDVRAMLRWAVEHEYLPANPIDGLKGPAIGPPRERSLSEPEIKTLWEALPNVLANPYPSIVRLCLLTAQRLGEITGMRQDELHLDRAEWHLSGSRTKNGHPHVVPLSGFALDIINSALAGADGSAFVFPHHGGPLPSVRASYEVSIHNPEFGLARWGCHDLRRTAISHMAGLGVAPITLAAIANHRSMTHGSVTMAVYTRYDYGREKRAALDLWADRLRAIIEGGTAKVLQLRGA
jgi:integrase